MKNILLILVFLTVIFSCKSNKDLDVYYGNVTAFKNGKPWKANILGSDKNSNEENFAVLASKYDKNQYYFSQISFRKIPKNSIKKFPLTSCSVTNCEKKNVVQTFFTTTIQKDVGCDIYKIVESMSSENYLEITKYNKKDDTFEGTFNATLAISDSEDKCNEDAPDTIRFTNGRFSSKITWR